MKGNSAIVNTLFVLVCTVMSAQCWAKGQMQTLPNAIRGTCQKVGEDVKRCYFPSFAVWGSGWKTTIGLSPNPPTHYIEVRQVGPKHIEATVYFDYSGVVKAAFDPDLLFHYRLVDANNAVIHEIPFPWWRGCGNVNINSAVPSDSQNLDAVANLDHIDLIVQWHQDVKWCG